MRSNEDEKDGDLPEEIWQCFVGEYGKCISHKNMKWWWKADTLLECVSRA